MHSRAREQDADVVRPGHDMDPQQDRRTVRLSLPPLPLASHAEPLKVMLDFETKVVDEMIDRLIALRAQLLPPPVRN